MPREKITNIRYGTLGKIQFDWAGETIQIREPGDVLLVGVDDQLAAKWIVQHYGFLLAQLPVNEGE